MPCLYPGKSGCGKKIEKYPNLKHILFLQVISPTDGFMCIKTCMDDKDFDVFK